VIKSAPRDAPCPATRASGTIDAASCFPTARTYAGCGDVADRRGGRDRLPSRRLSGRTGLGLDADGCDRRARGLCREDTAVSRALVLRAGRYSAGSSGHTRHAQGDCELAAERRAARRRGDLHDDRHRLLPALGTRLGPLVGIARCEPGLDGTGDGAVSRVRCGCARNRDRTRDARAVDRARPARGTCAVRLDRGARRINARRDRALARRACDPSDGVEPFRRSPCYA
jgi:hypothetical protein